MLNEWKSNPSNYHQQQHQRVCKSWKIYKTTTNPSQVAKIHDLAAKSPKAPQMSKIAFLEQNSPKAPQMSKIAFLEQNMHSLTTSWKCGHFSENCLKIGSVHFRTPWRPQGRSSVQVPYSSVPFRTLPYSRKSQIPENRQIPKERIVRQKGENRTFSVFFGAKQHF